ncbi:MAG TPA: hypothetical protein VH063_12135 [Gaiellaceae bacterium]|jgi:hypothetical protein|nr:hypothetical protein [Gaiellaceae bacterium]
MPGTQGYAVVSCHVERPLDDLVWDRYRRLLEARPGGFRIASLMRPPAEGENLGSFVGRARQACAHGPFGHHVHWTSPTHARPTGPDPAASVLREGEWLREQGLEPRFFCGGGWYTDAEVMAAVADLGYVDCTATSWRPSYLAADAPRAELDQPAWVRLVDGRRLLELPTTHSLGAIARALHRELPPVVHVHFHDYELLEGRRRAALVGVLRLLARRRRPAGLDELTAEREVPWHTICRP